MTNITSEEFDRILEDILSEMKGNQLLDIEGFYEVVSEYFNNEILERYDEEQAGLKHEVEEETFICPLMNNGRGNCGHYYDDEPLCPLEFINIKHPEYEWDCEELTEEEFKIIIGYMEKDA